VLHQQLLGHNQLLQVVSTRSSSGFTCSCPGSLAACEGHQQQAYQGFAGSCHQSSEVELP
jgi:hypothetical protein